MREKRKKKEKKKKEKLYCFLLLLTSSTVPHRVLNKLVQLSILQIVRDLLRNRNAAAADESTSAPSQEKSSQNSAVNDRFSDAFSLCLRVLKPLPVHDGPQAVYDAVEPFSRPSQSDAVFQRFVREAYLSIFDCDGSASVNETVRRRQSEDEETATLRATKESPSSLSLPFQKNNANRCETMAFVALFDRARELRLETLPSQYRVFGYHSLPPLLFYCDEFLRRNTFERVVKSTRLDAVPTIRSRLSQRESGRNEVASERDKAAVSSSEGCCHHCCGLRGKISDGNERSCRQSVLHFSLKKPSAKLFAKVTNRSGDEDGFFTSKNENKRKKRKITAEETESDDRGKSILSPSCLVAEGASIVVEDSGGAVALSFDELFRFIKEHKGLITEVVFKEVDFTEEVLSQMMDASLFLLDLQQRKPSIEKETEQQSASIATESSSSLSQNFFGGFCLHSCEFDGSNEQIEKAVSFFLGFRRFISKQTLFGGLSSSKLLAAALLSRAESVVSERGHGSCL